MRSCKRASQETQPANFVAHHTLASTRAMKRRDWTEDCRLPRFLGPPPKKYFFDSIGPPRRTTLVQFAPGPLTEILRSWTRQADDAARVSAF
jgi:hypothetical protein